MTENVTIVEALERLQKAKRLDAAAADELVVVPAMTEKDVNAILTKQMADRGDARIGRNPGLLLLGRAGEMK